MKRIVSLGKNQYVQLDSYGSRNETPVANFFVGVFAVAVMALTIGGALGVDITKIHSQQTQHETR
jgi:hypothetical protein